MNIPKEKLSMIGISIKVNRKARLKETKSGRWNQQNFSDGICSQNTLIKIERGQVSRFIEVYVEAAERLGLRLGYFPEVDKQIDRIAPKLYKAVEFYDLKKIMLACDKLLNLLDPLRNFLWYCDLFYYVFNLKSYFTNAMEIIDKNDMLIDMHNEFDFQLNELLKSLLFNIAYNNTESQVFSKLFEDLEIDKSEFVCNKVNTLMYYFANNKNVKFLRQLEIIEEECIKNNNSVRILDVYNMAVLYMGCYDVDEVDTYAKKIDSLISRSIIPDEKLAECFYCLGTMYYEISKFEKSIEYMTKCYKCDRNKAKLTFLFIGSCQSKLKAELSIPYYSDNELKKFSLCHRLIYKYYSMGELIPDFIKQKFIMEELLPEIRYEDEITIKILREELETLTQKTSHYKDLVIFNIRIKHLQDHISTK